MSTVRSRLAPGRTAESCGKQVSVNDDASLPCAQTPLCAHGSRSAGPGAPQETAEFQGKTAPVPRGSLSPMCNSRERGPPSRKTRAHSREPGPRTCRPGTEHRTSRPHRRPARIRPRVRKSRPRGGDSLLRSRQRRRLRGRAGRRHPPDPPTLLRDRGRKRSRCGDIANIAGTTAQWISV